MCWDGQERVYQHICQQPSGKRCVDCGEPAGTLWTYHWCPNCDVKRLDRITLGFEDLVRSLRSRQGGSNE